MKCRKGNKNVSSFSKIFFMENLGRAGGQLTPLLFLQSDLQVVHSRVKEVGGCCYNKDPLRNSNKILFQSLDFYFVHMPLPYICTIACSLQQSEASSHQ